MAKLTAPLLSLNARGKFARTIVFSGWKGEKTARQYVEPANPNTAAQQTVRTSFTDAVNEWHTAGYTADDKTAFNLLATTFADPRSGFNQMVKEFRDCEEAGDTWVSLYDLAVALPGAGAITVTVECASDETAVCYYGTSKTFMPDTDAGAYVGTTWTYTLVGLPSGVKHFLTVKNTKAGSGGRTGIISATTT